MISSFSLLSLPLRICDVMRKQADYGGEDFFPYSSLGLKEIWFAEVKEKSLKSFTSAGFEPTTSGFDHQRSYQPELRPAGSWSWK